MYLTGSVSPSAAGVLLDSWAPEGNAVKNRIAGINNRNPDKKA